MFDQINDSETVTTFNSVHENEKSYKFNYLNLNKYFIVSISKHFTMIEK